MHSFIISSKNLEKGIFEAKKIIKNENIDEFDITVLEFEKALGIEDVRNFQKNIFLSSINGGKKALTLVLNNQATLEAQNSILKLLEEPPKNTLIFIITQNSEGLIPTILSRGKIIKIEDEISEPTGEYIKNLENEDPLYLAAKISKEKSEAVFFLENLILDLRNNMLRNISNPEKALKFRKMIHEVELIHFNIKNTNSNHRLMLENLFLNLD